MSNRVLTRTAGSVGLRSAEGLGLATTAGTAQGEMPFVAGRFAVFDQWAMISNSVEGRFLEKVDRNAFTRTIREDRAAMRMLFQHGADALLGSRPIAPIDGLGADELGAWYFGRLFPGTLAAQELPPLLTANPPVLGSSFRFKVDRERVDDRPKRSTMNPEGLPERVVLEVTLYEFGPVVFPAYPTTTAGTSTGEHPPRSSTPPRWQLTTQEWADKVRPLPPGVTQEDVDRLARQRWLDRVMPLPRR